MYRPLFPLLVLLAVQSAQATTPPSPQNRYDELCTGCHAAQVATAFRNARSVIDGTVQEITRIIRDGRPDRGMPAFGRTLSEQEASSIAALLRESAASRSGTMVGRTIEAETLRLDRSAGFAIGANASDRFVSYVDRGSYLCYDDVDLTGVRSVAYRYAKGEGEPPRRFAIVAFDGRDFDSSQRIHLGERITTLTGGWETFRTERVGLSRQLQGRYRFCFIGMDGGGVFNLDKFTLSDQPGPSEGTMLSFEIPKEKLVAAGHSFRLEKIGELPGELWSVDFLSDGSILATQKSGSLWLFKDGARIGPIEGTPKVQILGQGGLHTVRVHPDHAKNGWIYLSYADPAARDSMTAIVRGRIRGNRWVDEQVIYKADASFYSESGAHYGSSFAFAGEYLYFSVGERGEKERAQDLSNPHGKIHRVFTDGSVPPDNPFVDRSGAIPTIWSYGHRNPQGVAVHPQTGELWAVEHGPRGGDELNRILKGANYGWPVVTFGTDYDGTIISNDTQKAGIEAPKRNWTPSIGVSTLHFYTGAEFPKWRNHAIVGSLARQELRLVRIESNEVTADEVLLRDLGRIRAVSTGPDGHPYVGLNLPNGMIVRLTRTD